MTMRRKTGVRFHGSEKKEERSAEVGVFTGGGGVVLVLGQNLAVAGVEPLTDKEGSVGIGAGFDGLGGFQEAFSNLGGALCGGGAIVSGGGNVDGMLADSGWVNVHGALPRREWAISVP